MESNTEKKPLINLKNPIQKRSKVERAINKWGAIENNIFKWHQNLIHILVVPIIFWLTIHI